VQEGGIVLHGGRKREEQQQEKRKIRMAAMHDGSAASNRVTAWLNRVPGPVVHAPARVQLSHHKSGSRAVVAE